MRKTLHYNEVLLSTHKGRTGIGKKTLAKVMQLHNEGWEIHMQTRIDQVENREYMSATCFHPQEELSV